MKRVLFLVRSLKEAELFAKTATFLKGEETFFLALRLDVYLWLKLQGKKVFWLGRGYKKGKVAKEWARFDIVRWLQVGGRLDQRFWGRLAFKRYKIDFLLKRIKPDLIVLWNGFYFEGQMLCSRSPCLFVENGFLPKTLQVDSRGVNFFSSLRKSRVLKQPKSLNSRLHKEIQQQSYCVPKIKIKELVGEWLFAPRVGRARFLFSILKGLWRYIHWKEKKVPSDFWLVILQQNRDSQLLFFSPYFSSKEEFAKAVLEYLPPEEKVVIRVHPKDLGREDFSSLIALTKKRKGAYLSLKAPLGKLLSKSKGIILINSTTAIEALSFLKPVFCLGQAFYDRLKIVRRIDPLKLRVIKPFVVSKKDVEGLLYYLKNHLVINEPQYLAQKIKLFLSL